jgi:hypothetical protein
MLTVPSVDAFNTRQHSATLGNTRQTSARIGSRTGLPISPNRAGEAGPPKTARRGHMGRGRPSPASLRSTGHRPCGRRRDNLLLFLSGDPAVARRKRRPATASANTRVTAGCWSALPSRRRRTRGGPLEPAAGLADRLRNSRRKPECSWIADTEPASWTLERLRSAHRGKATPAGIIFALVTDPRGGCRKWRTARRTTSRPTARRRTLW